MWVLVYPNPNLRHKTGPLSEKARALIIGRNSVDTLPVDFPSGL